MPLEVEGALAYATELLGYYIEGQMTTKAEDPEAWEQDAERTAWVDKVLHASRVVDALGIDRFWIDELREAGCTDAEILGDPTDGGEPNDGDRTYPAGPPGEPGGRAPAARHRWS